MDRDPSLSSTKCNTSRATSCPTPRKRNKPWNSSVCGKQSSRASSCLSGVAKKLTYAKKIQFIREQNNHDAGINAKYINSSEVTLREQKKEEIPQDTLHTNSDPTYSASLVNGVGAEDSECSDISLNFDASASKYYGVGEWATAALESSQFKIRSKEDVSQSLCFPSSSFGELKKINQKPISENNVICQKENLDLGSLSTDVVGTSLMQCKKSDVPFTNFRKRQNFGNEASSTKCNNEIEQQKYKRRKTSNKSTVSISALSNSLNSDVTAKKSAIAPLPSNCVHIPQHTHSLHQPSSLPLSPLLSDQEKDLILPYINLQRSWNAKYISVTPSFDKVHKNGRINYFVSHERSNCLEPKSFSKTNLNSRLEHHSSVKSNLKLSNDNNFKSKDDILLRSGDCLQLEKEISLADFNNKEIVVTNLNAKKTHSHNGMANVINTPEAYLNCIDTCVKVRCVQKVCKCKVCGFSIDVTHEKKSIKDVAEAESLLRSHVTEHSLKELYDMICKTPNR